MLSSYNLQKLVDHNFIDSQTQQELIRATKSGMTRYGEMALSLDQIIREISLKELHVPLGISNESIVYINNGKWSFIEKTFTFNMNPEIKFTLEELQNYYKLVCFLSFMDNS
jgi:RIO-like serine/threonine protein kinase